MNRLSIGVGSQRVSNVTEIESQIHTLGERLLFSVPDKNKRLWSQQAMVSLWKQRCI